MQDRRNTLGPLALALLGLALPTVHAAPALSGYGPGNRSDCGSAKSTPVASFPFNPLLLSELSPPVMEPRGAWRARLGTGELGAGVAYLIGSRRPGLVPTPGGMLLVEPSETRILQAVRFGPGQDVSFRLPIPDEERLCSQRIRVQAVLVTSGGTSLSNAFDLTLGR